MSKNTFEEIKSIIDEHFTKEMEIAEILLKAELDSEEWDELNEFMRQHPWAEFMNWFRSFRGEKVEG